MFIIDGVEYEDIDDYCSTNEELGEEEIICPYCKCVQEDVEPTVLYSENENEDFVCQNCNRHFNINSSVIYVHITTPIKDEVENLIENEIIDTEIKELEGETNE